MNTTSSTDQQEIDNQSDTGITVNRLGTVYVISALLFIAAMLAPEATEDPLHFRIIYSMWATLCLMIPAVGFFWTADVRRSSRAYWRLLWTSAFLIYLSHVYFSVFPFFGGVRGTFQGQGFWIASGNVVLTIIWFVDVILSWSATRYDYRIWDRHRYSHLILVLAFFFFASIRNDGVVRYLGIALLISLVGSALFRYFRGGKIRAKHAPEADGEIDLPRESFLGGTKEIEALRFRSFITEINLAQRRSKERAKAPKVTRAFHAKQQLGVSTATFTVQPDLPKKLAVSLFSEPKEYRATVRLSNAASTVQHDAKKDLRGFALRVHLDDKHAHDFMATDFSSSHARDAYQFMSLVSAISAPLKFLMPLRLALKIGPIETARMFLKLFKSRHRCDSLLTSSYWSRAPIAVGSTASRYVIVPRNSSTGVPRYDRPNYLREQIVESLAEGDIVFDLMLQPFVDEKRTPIEDSSVDWDESVSPLVRVGEIRIPSRDLTSPDSTVMEQNVSRLGFNPWITTQELRPLGSQNRARQLVYKSSSDLRLDRKKISRQPLLIRILVKAATPVFSILNRVLPWHKLPMVWLELLNLDVVRHALREKNLHKTDPLPLYQASTELPEFDSTKTAYRQSDGTYNDLTDTEMGKAFSAFGRNTSPKTLNPPSEQSVLSPSPREVSRRLLARESFQPATTLNMLAAAWIQFMIHGWFNHTKIKDQTRSRDYWRIPLAKDDDWEGHEGAMLIPKTPVHRAAGNGMPAVFVNTETHWWDGSQIYGNSKAETDLLRGDKPHSGYLQLDDDGKLPIDMRIPADKKTGERGVELSGFNDNWWVGLSMLHTLFAKEHNAICDHLKNNFPHWNDEQLFQTARHVNAALMAKIHTVEWTPGILGRKSLQVSMDANWWGLLGEEFTNTFGRVSETEEKSGIIGSATDHHSAPYAFTEEFVSVYRMHPLMPDYFSFHDYKDHSLVRNMEFPEINGVHTRKVTDDIGWENLFYSFGVSHPGAITLKNYPNFLRELEMAHGMKIDLATIDNLRDRERGVMRYNDFRRNLRLPPIRSWSEMTADQDLAMQIRDVYNGDLEKVDTMVGLLAETPPKGFGFSDTAFRIFVLMASRRLKSDRFYTNDFNVHTYSRPGLEWIRDNEMTDVILRHMPDLRRSVGGIGNAFAPWRVS